MSGLSSMRFSMQPSGNAVFATLISGTSMRGSTSQKALSLCFFTTILSSSTTSPPDTKRRAHANDDFWTTADLENKLLDFRTYFNNHRRHSARQGRTPDTAVAPSVANLRSFRWQPHCRSLYQTPIAALFSKDSRLRCGIRSTSVMPPRNHSVFLHRNVLRGSDRVTATECVPNMRPSSLSQSDYQ